MPGKRFKIRIKDCPEVKCCPALIKFIGKVRIATLVSPGVFLFTFVASSGFSGMIHEVHEISPHLVEILS